MWPFVGMVPRYSANVNSIKTSAPLLSRVPGAGLGLQRGEESRAAQSEGESFRGVLTNTGGARKSEGAHHLIPVESHHESWSLRGSKDRQEESGNVVRGYKDVNLGSFSSLAAQKSQRLYSRRGKKSSRFFGLDDGRRGLPEQKGFISLNSGRRGFNDNYGTRRGKGGFGSERRETGFTSLRQGGSPSSGSWLSRKESEFGNGHWRGGRGGWTSLREGG